jgi:hypothetical protein
VIGGAGVAVQRLRSIGGKFALFAVALVVAIGLLEWTSTIAYRRLRGEPFSKQRIRDRLAVAGGQEELQLGGIDLPTFINNKALHPYLGYVIDRKPDLPAVNRFGFLGRSPLLARSGRELVVAVFGGSVAWSLPHGILERELEKRPAFRDRPIQFVNLAMSGYKQPQQLLALTYFLALGAQFDVVINLDGFNDVVLPYTENLPAHVHPSFPRLWHLYSRKGFDPKAVSSYAAIEQARRERARWSARLAGSPWSSSAFVLSFWETIDRRKQNEISLATAELNRILQEAESSFQISGPLEPGAEREPLLRETVQLWAESSRQMAHLSRANGIRYFHFLQPNQYVAGSKPMSLVERQRALSVPGYGGLVRHNYPMLIEAGRVLAEEGIAFADLTRVFESEQRPVYVDTCCHFNELGYEIMIAEMAKYMTEQEPVPR